MKIKTLEAYTKVSNELREFEEKHGKVFAEYKALTAKVSEAESALKTDVKENYKDTIANDFFRVGYSMPTSKGYNAEFIFSKVTPSQKKKLIEVGAFVITEKVDDKKIVDAVEQGIIDKDIVEKAIVETNLAPRVTITLKK